MTSGDDAQAPKVGSHASVNGLELYYEVHGTGKPLVLLHGGIGAIYDTVSSPVLASAVTPFLDSPMPED